MHQLSKLGHCTLTIKDFVVGVRTHKIVPYNNNRGGTAINTSRVKEIITDFDPYSLGKLVVAPKDGKFVMADFHHRCADVDGTVQCAQEILFP